MAFRSFSRLVREWELQKTPQ